VLVRLVLRDRRNRFRRHRLRRLRTSNPGGRSGGGNKLIHSFFPTRISAAVLPRGRAAVLNARLLRECQQLAHDDAAGRRWSHRNYPGGFTSYASAHHMHRQSPTFARLQRWIDGQVARFAGELEFDLGGRPLTMTDCWVNVMPRGVTHSLHLHPLSFISGTYYVVTPPGCPGLKFEDPRLSKFMAAPPKVAGARPTSRAHITYPAKAGHVILFESWLRHEVAANRTQAERISISFNYNWS